MRPVVPALTMICVICVVCGPRNGRADDQARVQVAVIDLSGNDGLVKALSETIYRALNSSDVLRNPDTRRFDSFLIGPLSDEDAPHIDTAKTDRDAAETQLLTNYDSKKAEAAATDGELELLQVTPTQEVRELYAQLSLFYGLARLDQHDADTAARAFALTHRLDPTTQLDPAQYPPDITDAFQKAIEAPVQMTKLSVKGEGHVWIDGRERGDAPIELDVEVGAHSVVLTGDDRETKGAAVRVQQTPTPTEVEPVDKVATDELKVKRLRLALSRAQAAGDDAARASAMKRLATLLGVGDAVMISLRSDKRLQWEIWKDRAPGFSAPKLYAHQKAEELLEGIAPDKSPVDTTPKNPTGSGGFVRVQPTEPSWYQRRWVQASAATGLAAAIVGAILWARRDENVGINHDVKGM